MGEGADWIVSKYIVYVYEAAKVEIKGIFLKKKVLMSVFMLLKVKKKKEEEGSSFKKERSRK